MSKPQLDSNELMHLALHATQKGTPDKAILLLKQVLELEPENGKAIYLLGALHAEIGLYDQAVEEMTQALEYEPELHTARFQLGLLHLTSGRISQAEATWEPLDSLGEANPFFLFKKGMLHFVKDEFDSCVEELELGIKYNNYNEDLNNDMRRVLQDAKSALENIAVKSNDTESGIQQNKLLSLYKHQELD